MTKLLNAYSRKELQEELAKRAKEKQNGALANAQDDICTLHTSSEPICHVTLGDIGRIAYDMEMYDLSVNFTNLSGEQNEQIITKVLGAPIEHVRGGNEPYAPAIENVIRKHIETTIAQELKKLK